VLDSLAHSGTAPHAVTDWTTALTATHAPRPRRPIRATFAASNG
jgi:hypothetical protein